MKPLILYELGGNANSLRARRDEWMHESMSECDWAGGQRAYIYMRSPRHSSLHSEGSETPVLLYSISRSDSARVRFPCLRRCDTSGVPRSAPYDPFGVSFSLSRSEGHVGHPQAPCGTRAGTKMSDVTLSSLASCRAVRSCSTSSTRRSCATSFPFFLPREVV